MSRGWENKSVQGMMDDHDNRPKRREPEKSPERRAYEKQRYSIELSITGVQNDLNTATHPVRRAQLIAALEHLTRQLRQLEEDAPPTSTS